MRKAALLSLLLVCSSSIIMEATSNTSPSYSSSKPAPPGPRPLHSGYFDIDRKPGSSLFYAYWEAASPTDAESAPILLWLQGGPGCASTFGAFYELGPLLVSGDPGSGPLQPNNFSWHSSFGLLVIDQPVGTGYSIAASEQDIPEDMAGMAQDLYEGLWKFFDAHKGLQQRPFFITGESYAGKYVPSIAHYILQIESSQQQQQQEGSSQYCRRSHRAGEGQHHRQGSSSSSAVERPTQQESEHKVPESRAGARSHFAAGWRRLLRSLPDAAALLQQPHAQPGQQQGGEARCWQPRHPRPLDAAAVPAPNFRLAGVAIGNGLTDPTPQTRALAGVVFSMGLVSEATQAEISQRSEDVIQSVSRGEWETATSKRSDLLEFIQRESGAATLLDVRRGEAYDAAKSVDALLNSPAVRDWMRASTKAADYSSCSAVVERVMAADVMRSCLVLVEDLLDVLPVLLYQGQFDVQDGVASTNTWIKRLRWRHTDEFEKAEGQLWYVQPSDGAAFAAAAGWKRSVSTLTQVVVRNAGHMCPRDQPQAALTMMQDWVGSVLAGEEWVQQQQGAAEL